MIRDDSDNLKSSQPSALFALFSLSILHILFKGYFI